ncbi:putative acetyltransferase [Arthrobacter silviterrae]|uniref:GNAT family N-acetyltransferase n=1 Tax=Arthrobacter silviterrae TaxID=2026658 RepID=A0ABX0DDR4_9MICC|nr:MULTISPECIES: GNAT family N-acetyltransferase [Arthrobacter]MCU6480887.1 GNAT family N-acetyltransferase [Arthrobacter sp. A2-55]MDQ0276100.1 putative acetyltransferase [Arthrobacter silviterrae]NGN82565.1 GNAT family N-acetyltransferase [Arthrobacter silviterrae]
MSHEREIPGRNPRSFPYELRSFPVRLVDGVVPEEVAKWSQAVALGFYGDAPTGENLAKFAVLEQADGRMATGAYLKDAAAPAGAWGPEYPVATYAYHRKNLNVGGGTLLPVHQITAVTVRPSHRRRGILRAMISSDLAQAKAAGIPLAALTASEATIYGRFGFGVATHKCTVEVATRGGIAFHNPSAAAQGTVEVADPLVVRDLHHEIFARVHAATYGSIGRHDMYRLVASGQGNYASMTPVRNIRAALHYDDAGEIDGYVTYRPNEEAKPPTVEVVDLLAVGESAYLALWNYLGSLDLIERITWTMAPEVDPLEWAMAAKRDYNRTGTEDHLWLRILDTPAALAARHYLSDGSITVHVGDPLGHASGIFRIDVVHGMATVKRCPEDGSVEAELGLGVSELSSIYLGAVSARTLSAAGRVREDVPGAVARFDALFAPPGPAHSLTNF